MRPSCSSAKDFRKSVQPAMEPDTRPAAILRSEPREARRQGACPPLPEDTGGDGAGDIEQH